MQISFARAHLPGLNFININQKYITQHQTPKPQPPTC